MPEFVKQALEKRDFTSELGVYVISFFCCLSFESLNKPHFDNRLSSDTNPVCSLVEGVDSPNSEIDVESLFDLSYSNIYMSNNYIVITQNP